MFELPVSIYHDGGRGDDIFLDERLYEDDHIFIGKSNEEEVTVMIRKSDRSCHGFYHSDKYYFDSVYYLMES